MGTGERGEVAAVNRDGQAWYSREAGQRQSIAVAGDETAAVTQHHDSQYALGRGARLELHVG